MTNDSMGEVRPEINDDDHQPTLPRVFERDGIAETNSLDVADFFGKSHKNVMRDIRDLIEVGGEGCRLNFAPTSREVAMPNGGVRLEPAYDMNRDGFTLLAMGFTGKKALEFKLRYIEAFNAMEAALKADGVIDGLAAEPVGGSDPKPFGQWTAADQAGACRVLDKYEQMFPGNPEIIRWAAERVGFPMPPKHLMDRSRQGSLFGGEDRS